MKIIRILALLSFFTPALFCAHDTKQAILNAVTVIKPVQQIILDYLDVPDNLVRTFIMKPDASCSVTNPYVMISSEATILKKFEIETGNALETIKQRIRIVCSMQQQCSDFTICSADGKYTACQIHGGVYNVDPLGDFFHISDDTVNSSIFKPKIHALKFSPDSHLLAAACDQVPLTVYNMRDSLLEHWIADNPNHKKFATSFAITNIVLLAFSTDSKKLVCASQFDGLVNIFDVATGTRTELQLKCKPSEVLYLLEFTPNSELLFCVYDTCVRLHDAKTGEVTAELVKKQDFNTWTYSPDFKYIAGIRQGSDCIEIYANKLDKIRGTIQLYSTVGRTDQIYFVLGGTYLVYAGTHDDNKKIVKIFKNQAFDLDCPTPGVTNFTEFKSRCVVS